MKWIVKPYTALTLDELYAALKLRAEIFVVGQDCPYNDLDGDDYLAEHAFLFTEDGTLEAYLRIFPPGTRESEGLVLGRIVAREQRRGLGRKLMEQTLAYTDRTWPCASILIHAQTYACPFYEKFGFEAFGAEFLEDNIPHFLMKRAAPTAK